MTPNSLILSIETSCDETAVAITSGYKILSSLVTSQIKDHQPYGGVVPELASRKHITALNYLIDEALTGAKVGFADLSAIAVSKGPGLVGALMVGMAAAKTLAFSLDIPLIPINHIEAHIFSVMNNYKELKPPFLCLVVSGGHTMIVLVRDFGDYQLIGQTLDDAAGEAFDKVAKALGLPYPGGPEIEKAALKGDENSYKLPKPMLDRDNYDFSFSGLKTAVVYLLRKLEGSSQFSVRSSQPDIAASFQKAVTDVLTVKLMRAAKQYSIDKISMVGGVSSNNYIRSHLKAEAAKEGIKLYLPDKDLSTDNAAMVGMAADYSFKQQKFSDLKESVNPNLALVKSGE